MLTTKTLSSSAPKMGRKKGPSLCRTMIFNTSKSLHGRKLFSPGVGSLFLAKIVSEIFSLKKVDYVTVNFDPD